MPGTFKFVSVVVLLAALPAICSGQEDACFTSGSVAGIVIATIVVTLVMGGLVIASIWYLWKKKSADPDCTKPRSVFFGSDNNTPLEHHEKQLKNHQQNSTKESYAFDNPYFKDDEIDANKLKNNNPDVAEKGQTGFLTDNGDVKNSPNNKCNSKPKKNRPFSSIPFSNVFHQGSKKPRAMDDTCIPKHTERVEVPLRGHDFTGLGFNICGNMRDGIFVKDVLHRGPASESGKIKAGDKIVGVTVSFGGMVYEDALTILSYASPYDVRLELEKTSSEVDRVRHLALPASSPGSKARLASSSFRTGQRLFHPLYRSQSIDDLTQIGKDNNFHMNGIAASPGSKKSGLSSGPKRSQSIEASSGPKPRVQLAATENEIKGSRKSTSSCESGKKILPESQKSSAMISSESKKIDSPEIKSSRFRVENVVLEKRAPDIIPHEKTAKNEQSPAVDAQGVSVVEKNVPVIEKGIPHVEKNVHVVEKAIDSTEATVDKTSQLEQLETFELPYSLSEDKSAMAPQVPPRKVGGHGKRKAPAPPRSITETAAIVHRNAEDGGGQLPEDEFEENESLSIVAEKEEIGNSCSLTYDEQKSKEEVAKNIPEKSEEDGEASSSPKRKASSLGDLTTLDERGRKKIPASSTILERAVSLDLQQSLPEENLIKQKMKLKSPTFEYPEDASEEEHANSAEKDSTAHLKRWEGSWSKLQEGIIDSADADKGISGLWSTPVQPDFSIIANGHSKLPHSDDDDPSLLEFDSPFSTSIATTENSIRVTSTPLKNVVDSFLKDDVDIDDIPYLGNQSGSNANEIPSESISTLGIGNSSSNSKTTIPISLSIPVIKPNFSNYEKLPSPLYTKPPDVSTNSSEASEHLVTTNERQEIVVQELSNHQTTYKPVFSVDSAHKQVDPSDHSKSDISNVSTFSVLDIVNGNGLELSSSSYGQYRTASDESSLTSAVHSSLDSSVVESSPEKEIVISMKKHSLPEISGIKVHSGAAGFAKTLIISTPIEGESISLNDDLDSPPPKLEQL